jgi:hypothetical protein
MYKQKKARKNAIDEAVTEAGRRLEDTEEV